MSLVGVEPTRPDKGSLDFKSNASAISPQRHASGEAKVSSGVERTSVADGEGFGKSKLVGKGNQRWFFRRNSYNYACKSGDSRGLPTLVQSEEDFGYPPTSRIPVCIELS